MFSKIWARVTGADKKMDYPVQQASALSQARDYVIVFPYGVYSDLPDGVLLKELSGSAAVPVTVERPDGMGRGDVAVFCPTSGSSIILKTDGTIVVSGTSLKIDGDLEVTGGTVLGASVTSGGKDISGTHTHTGSPTAATGPVTPTGTPI